MYLFLKFLISTVKAHENYTFLIYLQLQEMQIFWTPAVAPSDIKKKGTYFVYTFKS